ncbi:hypothetical protein AOQ73_26745 [Bradyrhizobium pachyrhizi]|uniref:hypothetical protein n=1 Tax=Bradyrhizobium pachyrhizi TaxID=280333 RepID=UPI000704B301|nr:hypothetical protein [Bradyrhizobium pachyrhizi]KRP89223.1 hypothetical protein AOQ73_26745 [Bradyrhizobium pachyrhizi]
MQAGNAKLRTELQRLTMPPDGATLEWLDVQIREMQELNKRIPRSVRLHTRFSEAIYEFNCFMFALDVAPNAVRDMRLGRIFPGQNFIEFLLASYHLREVKTAPSIVIYFHDGIPQHAVKFDGRSVVSKWGAAGTHIWQHDLWRIPSDYGDESLLFASLPDAVDLYRTWAADQGL